MKEIVYVLGVMIVMIACTKEQPKDYVTISGKILNQNSDSLVITSVNFKKAIKVLEDGTFSDTLRVKAGQYFGSDGTEGLMLYLKNGYDLKLNLDTEHFDETVIFSGPGKSENNYLAKLQLLREKLFADQSLMELEENVFNEKMDGIHQQLLTHLNNTENLDTALVSLQRKGFEEMKKSITQFYQSKKAFVTGNLAKGKPSPEFINYENYKGGTTSLQDLYGKYVYIDLWATWCGPCKKEIPFLQEVERKYHDKDIVFVSISTDRRKDYDKWKKMVGEKQLTGIQLFANEDQTFTEAYKVMGIPRFILINPQGKIVSADAPRPSDKKLIKLFDELSI